MPIYEVRKGGLVAISQTSFQAEGLYERRDIQQLLKDQITVLDESLMVIAEEFGEWIDSSRRIDLLCLDTNANLVVVELKRSDDGAHMELQAIRYAAMVSEMTFDQAVDALARNRSRSAPDLDAARADILNHLSWSEPDEDRFADETRIILASADFGRELTTAVLWLREHTIDIRCVRLRPHRMEDGKVLLDVQSLIPLPETTSFQTQIGAKRQAVRRENAERHEERYKFWEGLLAIAKPKSAVHANRSPTRDGWLSGSIGRNGFALTYAVRQIDAQVELWISFGAEQSAKSKTAFQMLHARKAEIEAAFGGELEWQELPDRDGCRIRKLIPGGYKSSLEEWPHIQEEMVDAMIRLDTAFRPVVQALKI